MNIIITGEQGSGKTVLLNALRKLVRVPVVMTDEVETVEEIKEICKRKPYQSQHDNIIATQLDKEALSELDPNDYLIIKVTQ